mmetsp:Transcript_52903/g.133040  ORF Transcript_52903/g.133040 Transcript_52903/m.133040 type:complete len:203 (-) Transcript_52903:211-819(-)
MQRVRVIRMKHVHQRGVGVRGDARLAELQRSGSEAIHDGHAYLPVCSVRVGVFQAPAAANGDDVGRVEVLVERVCLARVDHEENLVVPLPLPHLMEHIAQILATDLLGVLELEKAVAAMAGHEDEDVAAVVRVEPFGARHVRHVAAREHADETLHADLVPAVVHLDIIAVNVHAMRCGVHDGGREHVARVACNIVRQHENDL